MDPYNGHMYTYDKLFQFLIGGCCLPDARWNFQ